MPFNLDPWLFWTLFGIVLLIVELLTPGFFFACLAVGALLSVVPALLGLGIAWQLAVFSLGSIIAFIYLRPLFNKPRKQSARTGVDALVGREVVLSTAPDELCYAEVKIDGDIWRVKLEGTETASIGTRIIITGYEGNILKAISIG